MKDIIPPSRITTTPKSVCAANSLILLVPFTALLIFLGAACSDSGTGKDHGEAHAVAFDKLSFREVTKLAEAGKPDAEYNLAQRYDTGTGTERNPDQAVHWLTKSADQGYAQAQVGLAKMYDKSPTKENLRRAFGLYLLAAKQGNAQGQARAGERSLNGEGTSTNLVDALRWLGEAASQGDAEAQYNLGTMYDAGKGVPSDPVKAVEYYQKAAEQGLKNAQYNLGASYGNGQGTAVDDVQAYTWFSLAAKQGHAAAARNCAELERGMTVDQLAKAQQMAKDFKPKKEQP